MLRNGLGVYGVGCCVALAASAGEPQYLVVDLERTNAVTYVETAAELPDGGLANDVYRTTRLVLRRIPAKGKSFRMGSPAWEIGHDCLKDAGREGWNDGGVERRLPVQFTHDYFIGVYPVTQRQYELLMGANPSCYKGAMRPVESVSFLQVRGTTNPRSRAVAPDSLLGKLRAKAGGLCFDLPTEAQWEYACRAGTETGFNNGTGPLSGLNDDPNAGMVGRHWGNGGKKSATSGDYWPGDVGEDKASPRVGAYAPNAWGLYDMHGGVYEWCLDWFDPYLTAPGMDGVAHDPVGPATGAQKLLRGGSFGSSPVWCRSAGIRWRGDLKAVHCTYGCRVALTLEPAPKEYPCVASRMPDVDRIVLPDAEKYGGHLQDVWFDGENLYWTHTDTVIKTDRFGKVLAKGDAKGLHAAGCQVRDGRLYAALCDMGKWERQGPTPPDPLTVRVFDAETLAFIEDKVLEVNDYAGSFTFLPDGTCLVGCLRAKDMPIDGVRYHHFDRNFKLIQTHVHRNLKVPMGIEVIHTHGDHIYLAIYPDRTSGVRRGVLVKLDKNFNEVARYDKAGQMGLIFDGPYVWTGGVNWDLKKGPRAYLSREPALERE